jgi:hypothetical protein
MTSLLTPAEAQALGAGFGLTTAEVQAVIDREEAEIIRRYGAHYVIATPISETVTGGGPSLYLKRAIGSVSSVNEYAYLGDTAALLTAADYYVWGDEGRITRLPEHQRWARVVAVSYVPVDDSNLRKMVLIELVRIATEQSTSASGGSVSGFSFSMSGSAGDATGAGWHAQREAQYARLGWLSR